MAELDDSVVASGCMDQVPATGIMKTLSWNNRKKKQQQRTQQWHDQLTDHAEGRAEVWRMGHSENHFAPQKCHAVVWKTPYLFFEHCKDDIVYLDVTGSIVQEAKGPTSPHYVYEFVVRHTSKRSSPLRVATYLTRDHTISQPRVVLICQSLSEIMK